MKLGVLADLHWSCAPTAAARWHVPYDFDGLAARCVATVDALAARGCELLVIAGDLTHEGDVESCDAAMDCILRASPIPVVVVEGNHDVVRDPNLIPRREDVRDAWRHAEAIAAESLVALCAVGLDCDAGWAPDRGPSLVADDSLWTVVVSHFPLVSHTDRLTAAGLACPGELTDRDVVLELLAATRLPTVVLSGHVHARDTTAHENVLQVSVSALVERPHDAVVVEVDPLGGTVRCTGIGSPNAERWLLAPSDERWDFADGSWSRLVVESASRHALSEA